jgi:sugar lactone lactonase YvrE
MPYLRVDPLPGVGPEHIAVTSEGVLYAGLGDGRVVRIVPDSGEPVRTLATTGGRPLGMELAPDGETLIVCDAYRGLLRVTLADGAVEVLCEAVDGESLAFCSNAAIASDGTIYFTQSSRRFNVDRYRGDLLEHSNTGRLCRYRDGAAELVADGFAFANGIVLTADESAAIVAETGAYCLTRVDLADGTKTPFVADLPAFPDNLTRDEHGLIWIAMVSPRDPLLDFLLPRHPRLRQAVWSIPERLQPGPQDIAWARSVDEDGKTVHDLRAWGAGYRMVTVARRHGSRLYLGSLIEPAIGVVELPAD